MATRSRYPGRVAPAATMPFPAKKRRRNNRLPLHRKPGTIRANPLEGNPIFADAAENTAQTNFALAGLGRGAPTRVGRYATVNSATTASSPNFAPLTSNSGSDGVSGSCAQQAFDGEA